MKISIKYIFLLLGFSLMYSCSDELNLFPHDSIAVEEGLNSQADFEGALKGIYSGFRRSGYFGATSGAPSIYFIPDVISDNVIINAFGRRSREAYYDWRYDQSTSPEVFWLSAYKVIQRANLILENIDKLEAGDFKNNAQGEALAARAIAHFDLVKLYSDIPSNGGSSGGIPYVITTDSGELPVRNSVSEVYSNILQDLNNAATLINADNGTGRLNKNAVNAYLSRVHLYMGNYSEVITAAGKVNGTEVARDKVFDLWKDNTEESVIWKVRIVEQDNTSIGVAWLQESPDGIRSEYNVDKSLYDLYQDNDIRKEVYFETSDYSGITYNHIVKYRGRLVGNANEVDAKAIRFSEVLLNRAEAYAETNQDALALADLDMLRMNRYEGFVSGGESGQGLKDAIALERRLELAFEGHRFFDLKRKNLPVQRSDFGDVADGSGEPAEFKTLPVGDHKWNMAIGEGEINANPNMQQNSGY